MKERFEPIVATVVGVGGGGTGLWVFIQQATSICAFVAAFFGMLCAICAFIWWMRKLKNDKDGRDSVCL